MSEETRQRIIQAGAELIHRKGFHNTGLQEILKASGVPKGSFYFYFDNKEAFGIELINHFMREVGAMANPILNDTSLPPLARLDKYLSMTIDSVEARGCQKGCLVGNLSQEMSDLSLAFREALERAWNQMDLPIARILKQAQAIDEIPEDLDVQQTADFLLATWQGALIHTKVVKNPQPLRAAKNIIFNKILA